MRMQDTQDNKRGGGWIAPSDVAALQELKYLVRFCDKVLGQGIKVGSAWYYACPWGDHTNIHLDVHEYNERGNAHCWRCGKRGNVFHVAAAVLHKDIRKDFKELVRYVAKMVGYELREGAEVSGGKERNTRWVGDDPARYRRVPVEEKEEEIQFMPQGEAEEVWNAVDRAQREHHLLDSYAEELGLPPDALLSHADLSRAAYGMLGLTPEKRLLFVYTAWDEGGRLRITMTKQRGLRGESPRFRLNKGAKKQVLYGAAAIGEREFIIITEGESDTLAARYALLRWAEKEYPSCREDDLPIVVAKPDAGTFLSTWARTMKGKKVIICADNDTAGVQGAVKTCESLKQYGVGSIYLWNAPTGCKDVRDVYVRYAQTPEKLMDEILGNLIIL